MEKKPSSISLLSEENIKKYVLPEYNLEDGKICKIKFKDSDKQRAVYRIDSKNRSYCLKKMYFSQSSLLFVYSAITWLYRKNILVPNILPTKSNGRFVNYEGMLFILTPWIEGEKCSYDNIEHLLLASKNLAKIHVVSKNFKPIDGSISKESFDHLGVTLTKHFNQLLSSFNLANKYNDKFSSFFLKHFDINFKLGKISLEACTCLDVKKLTSSLCHLDYVNKNIIIDKNKPWVIDFDKCSYDYCVHDISYFLRRLLKRNDTAWDLDLTIKCLKEYEKFKPLSYMEYKYILAYLAFPQKYWKISRDYYNNMKKCNHQAFYSILVNSVENEREQLEFAINFKLYIEKRFNDKTPA